jgi:hypothetical protein
VSPDFKDLLSAFNAHRVEYLVVGAHALAAHGYVRATGDLDVWVRPEAANARRVIEALRAFGAPLQDLSEVDLTRPGTVFEIGVAPIRIDVLTSIDGVGFDQAWAGRLTAHFADLPVPVLAARDLVANKRAVGRPQDLADVDWLERHRPPD